MKRILMIIMIAALLAGCATTYTNRNPVGEMFPSVSGGSLEEKEIEMPAYFRDSNALLLLGYKQDSQFDIDRWLIGLDMTKYKYKSL